MVSCPRGGNCLVRSKRKSGQNSFLSKTVFLASLGLIFFGFGVVISWFALFSRGDMCRQRSMRKPPQAHAGLPVPSVSAVASVAAAQAKAQAKARARARAQERAKPRVSLLPLEVCYKSLSRSCLSIHRPITGL